MSVIGYHLNSRFIRVVTLLMLSAYLFVPVYLFGHMVSMTDTHTSPRHDCPYILSQHSICPMNFSDHLNTWQNTLPGTIQSSKMLLFLLLVTFTYISVVDAIYVSYIKRKQSREIVFLYQELFSKGILNGKAY